MSIDDFTNSKICKSGEFCSNCRQNPQFRMNISKQFDIQNPNFICPSGKTSDTVDPLMYTTNHLVINDMTEREEFCKDCKNWQDNMCSVNSNKAPWKASCPKMYYTADTNLVPINEKIRNFFKFLADLPVGKKLMSDEEVIEHRLNICSNCPLAVKHADNKWSCNGCGCTIQNKVKAASSVCPKEFW